MKSKKTIFCSICQKNRTVDVYPKEEVVICSRCQDAEKKKIKEKFLSAIQKMSINDRLARIEEILFEQQK